MLWSLCRLRFKKNIEHNNTGSIIIPAKSEQKILKNKKVKIIIIIKKIIGSIIGPAMAGPTGPFATALESVDDCLPNHIMVHIHSWRLRTVSSPVQKEYLKKIPSHLLFRPNPAKK